MIIQLQRRSYTIGALALCFLLYWIIPSTASPRSFRIDSTPLHEESDFAPPSIEEEARAIVQELLIDSGASDIAVCAAIHNEGRFIGEWLLFHRLIGIDRFYLYDTGSDDDTIEVLAPWVVSGSVVLHQFDEPQGNSFQRSALRHCSVHYAERSEWLIDIDVDEFIIPTEILSANEFDPEGLGSIWNYPKRPLVELLTRNSIYTKAGAIVVSRQTFKNTGIQRLGDGESLLSAQVMRDLRHASEEPKFQWTKTLAHTARRAGWIFPGPHILSHHSFSAKEANVINVMAQNVGSVVKRTTPANEAYANVGDFFYAGSIPHRIYEPLVIYHYIQRDLDNCASKLAREAKIHPEDWRVLAGIAGCTGDEQYQETELSTPLWEPGSFYAAATKDTSMQRSYYGTHLGDLLIALGEVVEDYRAGRMPGMVGEKITRVVDIPEIIYRSAVV